MALNKRVYDDIPHVRRTRDKQDPQPHPYKAQSPHEVWFIDGRMMDFKLNGVKWWSIVILEGYSRTMLAAAVVYLPNADKYRRLTRRPPQGQKGLDERALM